MSRPDESGDKCPVCGGTDLSFGYGFAGGGLGGYTLCLDCDEVISKERSDAADCFNCIQERGES